MARRRRWIRGDHFGRCHGRARSRKRSAGAPIGRTWTAEPIGCGSRARRLSRAPLVTARSTSSADRWPEMTQCRSLRLRRARGSPGRPRPSHRLSLSTAGAVVLRRNGVMEPNGPDVEHARTVARPACPFPLGPTPTSVRVGKPIGFECDHCGSAVALTIQPPGIAKALTSSWPPGGTRPAGRRPLRSALVSASRIGAARDLSRGSCGVARGAVMEPGS
jgi:hypothetical protein